MAKRAAKLEKLIKQTKRDISAKKFGGLILKAESGVNTKKVFDSNISSLTDTRKLLQEEKLIEAVDLIDASNRLFLFGVGGSEIVATDTYHKFLRSPIPVYHSSDYHLQLMEASLLTPDDCAIFISHTGRSKETIMIAETAKKIGAKTIVITSQISSPLAKLGDVTFISVSEETRLDPRRIKEQGRTDGRDDSLCGA